MAKKKYQQKKQIGLFEELIPNCPCCGGTGFFVPAGISTLGDGCQLEKMVCDKCTFETTPVVLGRRDGLVDRWIKGVPLFVRDINRGRSLTADEY